MPGRRPGPAIFLGFARVSARGGGSAMACIADTAPAAAPARADIPANQLLADRHAPSRILSCSTGAGRCAMRWRTLPNGWHRFALAWPTTSLVEWAHYNTTHLRL